MAACSPRMRPEMIGVLGVLMATSACVAPAISQTATNNANVHVDRLFDHDGCTVYRFLDGSYHYYVRCIDAPGAPTTTAQTTNIVSCGKNCAKEELISTDVKKAANP